MAHWESRMMWIGCVGAAISVLLIFPPLIWMSSWKRWREGTTDRPDAAIYLGMVTTAAFLAILLASPAIDVARLLTG